MPGGEVLLGFLGGSVQPGSRNPDPISDLKVSFSHTRFQTWPLKSIPFFRSGGGLKTLHKTENMSSLHQKDFLKSISNSHITLSFLIIWSWNDEHIDTRSYFPCKPYPMPDQNGQNLYLFSDQNGAKTLPFGAAHTYMAYIWECPPEKGSPKDSVTSISLRRPNYQLNMKPNLPIPLLHRRNTKVSFRN